MALHRRTLLQVATGVSIGLVGCTGSEGIDGTETETPTGPADPGPEPQDIYVVIHNQLSQAITASVELSTEQTVLVDDEATIEPNGFTSVDTGIDETGRYDLEVVVDGREKGFSFDVDEYDLGMGSNIIFWVDKDDIRYGIED